MPNQTGKRYACATCGSEMLVTRAGSGELSCCGQAMQPRDAAAPPRSQQTQPGAQRG